MFQNSLGAIQRCAMNCVLLMLVMCLASRRAIAWGDLFRVCLQCQGPSGGNQADTACAETSMIGLVIRRDQA
ncbi:MAG: hypothetical protein CVU73_07035 [Deltaproteobacteria bacterium HGW-Deltaproteobacteria-8]|nr:MAG: hypothetical protein CVU73_07035 [Deltaproteobacteria bacterium HGW-Deltaproteobacteria-8]